MDVIFCWAITALVLLGSSVWLPLLGAIVVGQFAIKIKRSPWIGRALGAIISLMFWIFFIYPNFFMYPIEGETPNNMFVREARDGMANYHTFTQELIDDKAICWNLSLNNRREGITQAWMITTIPLYRATVYADIINNSEFVAEEESVRWGILYRQNGVWNYSPFMDCVEFSNTGPR